MNNATHFRISLSVVVAVVLGLSCDYDLDSASAIANANASENAGPDEPPQKETSPASVSAPRNAPQRTSQPASKDSAAKPAWTAEQLEMFERKVRPLLVRRCHECHGAEKHKGELRLTSRAALLQGGESGPVIDLAQPESSLLLKAVRYDGLEMPPTAKMPAAEIAILTDWIKQGAPWPADPNDSSAAPTPNPRRTSQSDAITDADREHWSFRPVVRPAVPTLAALPAAGSPSPGSASPGSHNADSTAPTQPLDLFIDAALRKKGLVANGRAPVDALVRRVFFALTGLPPTHDELVEWCERIGGRQGSGDGVGESGGKSAIADERFDRAAYAQLVDQLLARPAYGEHWARHWLDIVRFAQSNGYERDGYKPHAWRYRDYVVQAFAQDKPYDRFILEQLAGDELPDADGTSRMATGFYRLGVWDDEPDDARQAEFDGLDDVMVTIGASFMGLTIGCARCHEHKFDPIPQADYYRLLAFIRNVRPYANPEATATNATTLPTNDDATIRSRFAAWQARVREREQAVASAANDVERKKLTAQPVDARIDGLDWALAVRESNTAPPATHVLIRGNAGTPGPAVEPGFPLVLSDPRRDSATKSEFRSESPLSDLFPSSGRRLALARWLASPDNSLTARVIVNRVWHAHFGRGIVATTADFGAAGEPPTHPELLDWLADDLVRSGWSIKHLQRTILLSETFCRSSTIAPDSAAHQAALKSDPGSRLLWRFPLRRLAAESIRDRMLVATGELNRSVGGVEMYPRLSGEVLAGQSKPGLGWQPSPDDQRSRRSVYAIVKRGVRDPLLEAFDYGNTSSPLAERPVTTVAPQALILLHGRFTADRAERLADSLTRIASPAERVSSLYRSVLQRDPTESELRRAVDSLAKAEAAYLPLAGQLRFQTDVPVSLFSGYRRQLRGDEFLVGPAQRWDYFSGKWGGGYESIDVVDPRLGPFALWRGGEFRDGVLRGRLRVGASVELVTLIARGRATAGGDQGPSWSGAAVTIDRTRDVVELRDRTKVEKGLDKEREEEIESRPLRLPPDRWTTFRWELRGDRSRMTLGEEPLRGEERPRGEVPTAAKTQQAQPPTPSAKPDSIQLDLVQPNSIEFEAVIADAAQSGRLGVAVWGGAVDFADLQWSPLGDPAAEQPNANPPNAEQPNANQPNANQPLDLARHSSLLGASSLPPGWSHYDGQWTRLSEQVWQVAPNQGAKLIWDAQPLKSGEVEMEMRMTPGRAQIGGFILRVSEPKVGADNWFGYEVSLNAGDKSILFGEHRNNWTPRRTAPFPVKPGEWHHLRVVLDEARLRVFVDRPDEPQIDIDLPSPLAGAGVGLRTWGSEIQYRNVQVRRGSEVRLARWPAPKPQAIATTADADWARRQALAALARVLFNSNEFVYVD